MLGVTDEPELEALPREGREMALLPRFVVSLLPPTVATILLTALFMSLWVFAGVVGAVETVDKDVHEAMIRGFEDQISLLKWGGGIVIGSLASAVATLFWRTVKLNGVIVREVKASVSARVDAADRWTKLDSTLREFTSAVRYCPPRLGREIQDGGLEAKLSGEDRD